MLRNSVESLLLVHDGCVEEYSDDLGAYEAWVLNRYRDADAGNGSVTDNSRKEKRQQAAASRERLRPVKKAIASIERELDLQQQHLTTLQAQLADADLYQASRKEELAGLLKQEGELKRLGDSLEERWLEQQQQLEELTNG
jgi:ATP-binding cassette subfamily F protein 3